MFLRMSKCAPYSDMILGPEIQGVVRGGVDGVGSGGGSKV